MQKFIGRIVEKKRIKALLDLSRPSIAVIYGRRRIGKSELIRQAIKGKNTLNFEGLEGQSKQKQIKNFLFQLSEQTGLKKKGITDWPEALILLREPTRSGQWVIVLDEFQWMANYQNELVSVIKMIWEKFLSKNPRMTLILCGSIASFMKSKVLKSSALYGRCDYELNLRPLKLQEMSEFFPGKGSDEILDTAMFVGGVPKYLELISEHSSVYEAMTELAFSKDGYFKTEYERLFASHFGKNPIYRQIIQTLAENPYGFTTGKVAEKLGVIAGGSLSSKLDDLESAGFLYSMVPFDKPETSKLRKYVLIDAYTRFYTSMINMVSNKKGPPDTQFHTIMAGPGYASWLGRAFEYLCMQHHEEISKILGFHGIPYIAGPFFQRKNINKSGVQIDLLFERSDKVLVLCEMKYQLSPVAKEVIEQVNRKVLILQEKYPGRTILKILLTKSRPTDNVVNAGYFAKIIKAEDLIHC
ncbi:MAG: AAA family ATPase [Fibrobacteria bacterium]|nr:AAA family ATPase [Fibrobacteria bacterium]